MNSTMLINSYYGAILYCQVPNSGVFLCEEKQNIFQYGSSVTKIIMMFFDPGPIFFNSFNETK